MADVGSVGTFRGGPGLNTPASWWGASAGMTSTAYLSWPIPGWGWWTTPTFLALANDVRVYVPNWQSTALTFSTQQGRALTGNGSLSGDIQRNQVAGSYAVFLFDRKQKQIVDGLVAAADGSWAFGGLSPDAQRFATIGFFDPYVEQTALLDYLTAG